MSVKRASAGNRQQALPQRQEQAGALSHTFAADALCVNHQVSRHGARACLSKGAPFLIQSCVRPLLRAWHTATAAHTLSLSCSLTPVKAVPERAQAKGSRYQGEMEMRYKLAAKDTTLMSTARQALLWSISKTCVWSAHSGVSCSQLCHRVAEKEAQHSTLTPAHLHSHTSSLHAAWT